MKKPLAVIVGAGPGVSASVAKKFGQNDYRIVLVSRKQESVDALASDLTTLDIEAYGMTADAANSDSVIAAFDRIKSEYGNPEVLIYNAGANTPVVPTELTVEDLRNDFEINVAGALVSAQQVIPSMVESGKGTLLFTGGGLAMNPIPARASASLTKAGLRNLVFAIHDELAEKGVYAGTVMIGGPVQPGTFYNPEDIAEAYWELHTKQNQKEIFFKES